MTEAIVATCAFFAGGSRRLEKRTSEPGEVQHSCGGIVWPEEISHDGWREVCPYCEDN